MKNIYRKKANPVEEILGDGMREFLRGKMIRLRATIIDKDPKNTRLSFKLDQEGYVVQFPEPLILTIVMPTRAVKLVTDNVYDLNEKHFKKACIEPLAKLRERLVMKYGMRPSLVRADIKDVYPEL